MSYSADFEKALQFRPPNIRELFPNSRALIVSGKAIDRAMLAKGHAIAMAANGRNYFVIRGALKAAQRAKAALIIEIAKSEGGQKSYCAISLLEPRPLRRRPLQRNGHNCPGRRPRGPLRDQERQGRRRCKNRDTDDVRRGLDLHRRRCLPPARRPEPSRQHRAEPIHSEMGGPRDRGRRDQGERGALYRSRSEIPDPGVERLQDLPRLDRPKQRHHPRHRGDRRGHTGGADRRDPPRPRPLQSERRTARHVRQQLRPAAGNSRENRNHQGKRRHCPADDLVGPRGKRLRQRPTGRKRQLHQAPGRRGRRGPMGRNGRLCRRQGVEEGGL